MSSGGAILESTGPRKTPYECKICGTKFAYPELVKSPDQEGASKEKIESHEGAIAGTTPEKRRTAFENLCRRYWKPVYNYVRHARCKMSDEAKDLTQGFFAWLFEAEPLRRYSPDKVRFRGFLKHMLRGFLSDQTDYDKAAKRGGGMKGVPVDQIPALESYLADNRSAKPEEVFDWAWKKELLDRAIERAREWFLSTGRANQFRAFEEFDLSADRDQKTMGQVGEKLGVKESDVRNYLHAVREHIRQEIRSEIAQTVSSLDSLEEEWNELIGRRYRSVIYRALRLPDRLAAAVVTAIARIGPLWTCAILLVPSTIAILLTGNLAWNPVFLVFGPALALVALWSMLFLPVLKLYEHLTLADIRAGADQVGKVRGFWKIGAWPFWIRFMIPALSFGGLWIAMVLALYFNYFEIGLGIEAAVALVVFLVIFAPRAFVRP